MVFVEEQNKAGASGLRSLKDAGSPQWCWQTISYLQTLWQSLDLDYEKYMAVWSEAEDHRVWEKVPYEAPFGTKEGMLHQLAIEDDKGAQRRMRVQSIAARAKRISRHGGDRNREGQGSVQNLALRGSTADYLTARIARDAPDVLERMKAGEFESVAAAAKAAGIELVKPKKRMTLSDDITRVAARLREHYTPEQRRALLKALDEDE